MALLLFLVEYSVEVLRAYILSLFLIVAGKYPFTTKYDVSCRFFICALHWVRKYLSIPKFLRNFIRNGCWILSNVFLHTLIWLCSFSVNMANYIDWFLTLNQSCFSGINPSWSWYIFLCVYSYYTLLCIVNNFF